MRSISIKQSLVYLGYASSIIKILLTCGDVGLDLKTADTWFLGCQATGGCQAMGECQASGKIACIAVGTVCLVLESESD